MTVVKKRILGSVAALVVIGLVILCGWLYFFFDGGTPWGKNVAEVKMLTWINQTYGIDAYYQVIVPTRYDFKLNAYTLDVRFKSNPSTGYTLEIPDGSNQVKVYDTYSYSK